MRKREPNRLRPATSVFLTCGDRAATGIAVQLNPIFGVSLQFVAIDIKNFILHKDPLSCNDDRICVCGDRSVGEMQKILCARATYV